MNKVPQVTLLFWCMKIAATTLGETGGDLLSMTLGVGYTASSIILFALFVIALLFQLRAKDYQPALYWLVIVATSTSGTTISDMMDRTWGLGYATGSSILLGLLALLFVVWRATGDTLDVSRITRRRTELLYWATILVSNTLGTALGDFLADSSGLGFAGGAALIGGILLLITACYATTRISRVLLFWLAFVLTRPFGAQFGDVLTKAPDHGGMGLGTGGSSVVLAAILLALLALELRKPRVVL